MHQAIHFAFDQFYRSVRDNATLTSSLELLLPYLAYERMEEHFHRVWSQVLALFHQCGSLEEREEGLALLKEHIEAWPDAKRGFPCIRLYQGVLQQLCDGPWRRGLLEGLAVALEQEDPVHALLQQCGELKVSEFFDITEETETVEDGPFLQTLLSSLSDDRNEQGYKRLFLPRLTYILQNEPESLVAIYRRLRLLHIFMDYIRLVPEGPNWLLDARSPYLAFSSALRVIEELFCSNEGRLALLLELARQDCLTFFSLQDICAQLLCHLNQESILSFMERLREEEQLSTYTLLCLQEYTIQYGFPEGEEFATYLERQREADWPLAVLGDWNEALEGERPLLVWSEEKGRPRLESTSAQTAQDSPEANEEEAEEAFFDFQDLSQKSPLPEFEQLELPTESGYSAAFQESYNGRMTILQMTAKAPNTWKPEQLFPENYARFPLDFPNQSRDDFHFSHLSIQEISSLELSKLLFSSSYGGGSYSKGVGRALARYRANVSLAGMLGIEVETLVKEPGYALKARWFRVQQAYHWARVDTHICCIRPGGKELLILRYVDTR